MSNVYVIRHTTVVMAKDKIEALEKAVEKIYDGEENVVKIDISELPYEEQEEI